MGFYYVSIFSVFLLGIVYAALLLIFWGIARVTRGLPGRKTLLGVVGAIFLVLPVGEELWIAWNFGQACKQAGTFIYKKVQVEGFYDDTHGWRADKLSPSGYQFVEGRDNSSGRPSYWRHERTDDHVRSFKINRPTARYHFLRPNSHSPVAYKVVKHEDLVTDTQTNEVLGRELVFGRYAPWFYIGLDRPVKLCRGKRDVRGSLYVNVLFPADAQGKGDRR